MIRSSPASRKSSRSRKHLSTSTRNAFHQLHNCNRCNTKHKTYAWSTVSTYKSAPTHRAFTQMERSTLEKAVKTYMKTLDFPVEELIDWKSIRIPHLFRRTAQECKDEWYTRFGCCYDQPVCLSRGSRFWRIQYYNNIVDHKDKKALAEHPAFVYHGVIGSTRPRSYLIPHTSAKEVQQLIRQKKKAGYVIETNSGPRTGAMYLQYDDLRNMPIGTEFTVGTNNDTGSSSGDYNIERVRVKEHLENSTLLHSAEHPSDMAYILWRGTDSTLAVYTNAQFPLIVHPNPQDPVYDGGCYWRLHRSANSYSRKHRVKDAMWWRDLQWMKW